MASVHFWRESMEQVQEGMTGVGILKEFLRAVSGHERVEESRELQGCQ